jgi:exodeoxyribonuclease-5
MVNIKLASDIESYGVPVLVLGDPAQLPPVEGGGHYTEAQPDWMLTEVQRQALDSPVLSLATRVRESRDKRLGLEPDDMAPASLAAAMEHDQVLVWSNKRRWALIEAMRRKLGMVEARPTAGDKIMCLTNNRDLAVFNGELFTVLDSKPATLGPTLTVRTEDGRVREIPAFDDGFMGREMQDQAKKSGAGMRGGRMLATFAQAITVHKAQGSEWGSVYVVNETPSMIAMNARHGTPVQAMEQARRWLYTAVTRAKDHVTVTAPSAR